jgi:hypothetical protein
VRFVAGQFDAQESDVEIAFDTICEVARALQR